MKKPLLALLLLIFSCTCFSQSITYPVAEKIPVTDEFYKKYSVTDDYRWMENPDAANLKKWVNDENAISAKFINKASRKNDAMTFIERAAAADYSTHIKKGKYYFFYAYDDGVSMPSLFIATSIHDDEPHVLVNPNFESGGDKISINNYEVSANSKYLAYTFSRNGSDWEEIRIVETDGAYLKDHLTHVKFSSIAWHGDGFYYSAYPAVGNLAATGGQTVYYHKLNTPQSEDVVVFKRNDPSAQFTFLTTNDQRYFILEEHNLHAGIYNYFFIDYNNPDAPLRPFLSNQKFEIEVINSHEGKFIAKNFHDAENGSIVEIDPENPLKWKTIAAPYSQALLMNVVPLKNKIIAVYQSKSTPTIVVTDYEGKQLTSIAFPLGTSIRGLNGLPNDAELIYTLRSYTTPPVSYTFNTESYESKIVRATTVYYDYKSFVYKQAEYKVNDTLSVPMLLIYKNNIKLDGNNPTLLEAYGGFGIVSEPAFDPGIVYFLNNGGVYAYAYIRGGGELGSKWAQAGKGINKQNSFNDFIAGAEYLIKEKYTSPQKLAITGASNGGLVVAAAAIQRPDLFKAVVPVVAPFDMLRFENFTIGNFHFNEYGTVKDSAGFTRLYKYSPYNNIKPNVNYPAMFIVTSENDDRVPPLHSYKFAAKMQSRPVQTNPILLMVNKQAGHNGIGDHSFLSDMREKANLYGFVMEMLK